MFGDGFFVVPDPSRPHIVYNDTQGGIIGVTDFFDWIKLVRDGDQSQRKTVKIELMDEAHVNVVMTWVLTNAKPKNYKGATLNAKGGTDVAIEEMVLSCEKIDVS